MVLCFSLQSLSNFQKYLEGKTSISESEIMKPMEALPTFSICSEPSFDVAFLKQFNVSPNLFLGSFRLSFLNHEYSFPINLKSDFNSGLTLQHFWDGSALRPRNFDVGIDKAQCAKAKSKKSVRIRDKTFAG